MADSVIDPDIENFIEKFLLCPITGKIFNIPVINKEGEIYESSVCPSDDVYVVLALKSFIGSLIDRYPEIKIKQFDPSNLDKKQHMLKKNEINNLITTSKYANLKNYSSFSLKHIPNDLIIQLVKNADVPTLEYFIDNTIDLSIKPENSNYHLINHICCFRSKSDPKLVQYIIDKGQQMKLCCDEVAWYPLQQILHNCTHEWLQKYAINKHIEDGLNLNLTNKEGTTIWKYILSKPISIIKYSFTYVNTNDDDFKSLIPDLMNQLDNNINITNEQKDDIIQMMF